MTLIPDITQKLHDDPDFVAIKRFDYSIKKMKEKYPESAPKRLIAVALKLTEPELEDLITETLAELKQLIEGPNNEDQKPTNNPQPSEVTRFSK